MVQNANDIKSQKGDEYVEEITHPIDFILGKGQGINRCLGTLLYELVYALLSLLLHQRNPTPKKKKRKKTQKQTKAKA